MIDHCLECHTGYHSDNGDKAPPFYGKKYSLGMENVQIDLWNKKRKNKQNKEK